MATAEEKDIGEPVDYKYEEATLVAAIVVANTPLMTLDGSEVFTSGAGCDDFVLLPDSKPAEFRKNVSLVLGSYADAGDSVYFLASAGADKEKDKKDARRRGGGGDP